MRRLRTDLLPLVSLVWSSPVSLVCGGHDCVPVIFQLAQDQTITAPTKLERAGPEAVEAKVDSLVRRLSLSCCHLSKPRRLQAEVGAEGCFLQSAASTGSSSS